MSVAKPGKYVESLQQQIRVLQLEVAVVERQRDEIIALRETVQGFKTKLEGMAQSWDDMPGGYTYTSRGIAEWIRLEAKKLP